MADIELVNDKNIFDTGADAIVNTVNTRGVMGKGIALEFKNRFPTMFETYSTLCKDKKIKIGTLFLWSPDDGAYRLIDSGGLVEKATIKNTDYPLIKSKLIINIPTKDDWKMPSKIEYIEAALKTLTNNINLMNITSIAMPQLGTVSGRLSWGDVKVVLFNSLKDIPNLKIYIYRFNPNNIDELSDKFKNRLENMTTDDVSILLSLPRAKTAKMLKAINTGEVKTLADLGRLNGFGSKSIYKVYDFLRSKQTTL